MKHTLAIIAALLLGTVPATAYGQGSVGIKGGVSFGNVSNQGLLPGSLDNRTGFAGGVALSTGHVVGLGLEGLYAQRGVESSNPAGARALDYIDVPLYLRAALPTPGVGAFAYAGPQVSFELSCKSGLGDCPDTDRPKTSYAGVIGAGVRIGWPSAFTLEGRYIYGLTDLRLSTVTSSDSYKTRSFIILTGIAF